MNRAPTVILGLILLSLVGVSSSVGAGHDSSATSPEEIVFVDQANDHLKVSVIHRGIPAEGNLTREAWIPRTAQNATVFLETSRSTGVSFSLTDQGELVSNTSSHSLYRLDLRDVDAPVEEGDLLLVRVSFLVPNPVRYDHVASHPRLLQEVIAVPLLSHVPELEGTNASLLMNQGSVDGLVYGTPPDPHRWTDDGQTLSVIFEPRRNRTPVSEGGISLSTAVAFISGMAVSVATYRWIG